MWRVDHLMLHYLQLCTASTFRPLQATIPGLENGPVPRFFFLPRVL